MHALTVRFLDTNTREVKIDETIFIQMSTLDRVEQAFVLEVFGEKEYITVEISFDPPLVINDPAPPPEAGA